MVFEQYPFITGLQKENRWPKGLKTYLPFRLQLREDLGLIVQKNSEELEAQLKLAYETGSIISTPLGSGNLNQALASEILGLVEKACGTLEGKMFFEPGCGTGFLLEELLRKGAKEVAGCEPGPQCLAVKKGGKLKIYNAFFNELKLKPEFDCVYHYAVLEHIKDPEQFMLESMQLLNSSGIVFAAVPGCRKDMELGNFMILAHEHYNYFTENSLKHLFEKVGLVDVHVGSFQYSNGIIYAWGKKQGKVAKKRNDNWKIGEESVLMEKFTHKTSAVLKVLQKKIDALEAEGKSLGLYGAPRSIVGLLKFKTAPRIFDGDVFKHGQYFAGSTNPIESPKELLKKPVDELWILPIHHDRAIRQYLEKEILPYHKITIFSLLEFMNRKVL